MLESIVDVWFGLWLVGMFGAVLLRLMGWRPTA